VTGLKPPGGHPGMGGGVHASRGASEFSVEIGLAIPPASKTERRQKAWVMLNCILGNDKEV